MGAALSVVRATLLPLCGFAGFWWLALCLVAHSRRERSLHNQNYTEQFVTGAEVPQGLFVVPPLAISFATGLAMKNEVKGWYRRLDKPSWTPPGWVFGPVSAQQAVELQPLCRASYYSLHPLPNGVLHVSAVLTRCCDVVQKVVSHYQRLLVVSKHAVSQGATYTDSTGNLKFCYRLWPQTHTVSRRVAGMDRALHGHGAVGQGSVEAHWPARAAAGAVCGPAGAELCVEPAVFPQARDRPGADGHQWCDCCRVVALPLGQPLRTACCEYTKA